ncbi:MAG: undecaprenyl diphosphate synthase family protein, partial [Clostridia bacterium]|nr:undecaprenyl diphosphate synthase family protein [Clostridia bacterium]
MFGLFKNKKQKASSCIDPDNLPKHIGIIMDGNGRWAKKRGLPRSAGHSMGARVLEQITRAAGNIGIKYLTVYAFSTENWSRPA